MNASRNDSRRVGGFPIFGTSNIESVSRKFRLLQNLRQLLLVPMCAACLNSAIFLLRAYFTREINFHSISHDMHPYCLLLNYQKPGRKAFLAQFTFFAQCEKQWVTLEKS